MPLNAKAEVTPNSVSCEFVMSGQCRAFYLELSVSGIVAYFMVIGWTLAGFCFGLFVGSRMDR